MENIKLAIENAQTALGIEFGSTRIKAVLIGKNHEPLASGSFDWENSYDNGVVTVDCDGEVTLDVKEAAFIRLHFEF